MPYILTSKVYGEDLGAEELSLFPTESVPSVSLSQEELIDLSCLYNKLYLELITNLSSRLASRFGINLKTSEVLSRITLIPLTHFFMDRLLRLDRFLKQNGKKPLLVANPGSIKPPKRLEDFREGARSSYAFNQFFLCLLAPLYGLEVCPEVQGGTLTQKQERSLPATFNNNYAQAWDQKARRALLWLPHRLLSRFRVSLGGRIPVLAMGYASPVFQAYGFYGRRGFLDLTTWLNFHPASRDMEARKDVLIPFMEVARQSLEEFLKQIGIEDARLQWRVIKVFFDYLLEFYPDDLLEGIPQHLDQCLRMLKKVGARCLIAADYGDIATTYFFAAARELGMKIIGYQQGGHEGYEDDYVSGNELEYPLFDRLITWGWRRLPDCATMKNVETVPLPSPWLAQRKRSWQKAFTMLNGSKAYDILLMPNKIYLYPPAPGGGAISRIDHIQGFARFLKELVKKASDNGIKILHKPYNQPTTRLLSRTLKELEILGGQNYKCLSQFDKGLTPEIVNQCQIVLWDQPGTGFLECLSCGIPTMVLWPRLYNQEVPWASEIFADLESVGIIHRGVDPLLLAYRSFLNSPQQWMQDPTRVRVVSRFCQEYAWSEEGWAKRWRDFLNTLN